MMKKYVTQSSFSEQLLYSSDRRWITAARQYHQTLYFRRLTRSNNYILLLPTALNRIRVQQNYGNTAYS